MVTSAPLLTARVADDDDFLRLKEMAKTHDDWFLDLDSPEMKIWSKSLQDASIKMVKVWSVFSAITSKDLFDTLMDPSYRSVWDSHLIEAFDIGHLNPNNVISYYSVSCPPPLRSRDFVLHTSWLDRGSEQFILSHSVCHKDYPPKKNFIRGISYFTGYFIVDNQLNGCEMYFVTQTDPQGIIPSWIVNKCTQILAPRFVRHLEKSASTYREWKLINNPQFTPWVHPEQMLSPKISLADCVPCEEELQSSFYQYVISKSPNIPTSDTSNREMAGPSKCRKIKTPPREAKMPNTKPQSKLPGTSQKDEKQKKSKASCLNFTKMCFRKHRDS